MAANTTLPMFSNFGIEELSKKWTWFVALGILLTVLGIAAISCAITATFATVMVFGWLMLFGGSLQTIHAFATKGWSGFFLDLFSGILTLVVGFMMVANPEVSALALTLLVSLYLMFSGCFRAFVGLAIAYQNRWWMVLHGMVSFVLGVAIWQQWPLTGLWVIGLFVGIDLIFNGVSLFALGLAARKLPGMLKNA